MKAYLLLAATCLLGASLAGQLSGTEWYSETEEDGIRIQNSLPKGGPYTGPVEKHYNYSYLVFFTRVVNGTDRPVDLQLGFSGEPVPIPESPATFVKLFLPRDTMTFEKRAEFSYGITELESLDGATTYACRLAPGEDCLYYTVALFYQTNSGGWNQERGGNRAEYRLRGREVLFHMPPQVEALPVGGLSVLR